MDKKPLNRHWCYETEILYLYYFSHFLVATSVVNFIKEFPRKTKFLYRFPSSVATRFEVFLLVYETNLCEKFQMRKKYIEMPEFYHFEP